MGKRDPKFDGSYATSRRAGETLDDDLKTFIETGCIVGETEGGGLIKINCNPGQERIDLWGKGEPGNYDHFFYKNAKEYGKAPDNRFENNNDKGKKNP